MTLLNNIEYFLELVDKNLIFCLPPMILTLLLLRALLKNRLPFKKAFAVIRWIILVVTLIAWLAFIALLIIAPDESAMLQRLSGEYKWIYVFLFVSSFLVPLILFNRRLAAKPLVLLVVAIFMRIGWYLERVVVIRNSYLTMDDLPERYYTNVSYAITPLEVYLLSVLQGIVLAVVLVGTLKMIEEKPGDSCNLSSLKRLIAIDAYKKDPEISYSNGDSTGTCRRIYCG